MARTGQWLNGYGLEKSREMMNQLRKLRWDGRRNEDAYGQVTMQPVRVVAKNKLFLAFSRQRILHLHSVPSSAWACTLTSATETAMSSLTSINHLFGLPRFLFPGISILSILQYAHHLTSVHVQTTGRLIKQWKRWFESLNNHLTFRQRALIFSSSNSAKKTIELLSIEKNAVSQHSVEYIQSSLDIGKVAKQFQGGQSLVKGCPTNRTGWPRGDDLGEGGGVRIDHWQTNLPASERHGWWLPYLPSRTRPRRIGGKKNPPTEMVQRYKRYFVDNCHYLFAGM